MTKGIHNNIIIADMVSTSRQTQTSWFKGNICNNTFNSFSNT